MSLLESFRKGSFRGVEFDTFTLNRGKKKKYTEHQFANSNRRYIEERGVTEADFSVTMSIFGKDDYISRRDALRKALEEEGEGVLVLPFEGEFNAKCVDYSDSQNIIENLGRCDFTASFKVCSENETSGNPVKVKNAKISLSNTVKSLRETVASMVNNNMIVSNAVSYSKGLNKLNNFAQKMMPIANRIANGSFSSMLSNFTTSIPSFLGGNVSILGSAISTLFYTFESVYDNAGLLLSSSETLFDYGDTDIKVSPSTPERAEQAKNEQVLNTQIKVSALGTASNAFANNDFSNEEELKEAERIIEEHIENILKSDAFKNKDIVGINEVQYYIKKLQVDFSDVVAEKTLTTPKLKEIEIKGKSVSLIAYQYYNDMEKVDDLIKLNNIQNPKDVNGKIRIFTDV